MAKFTEGELEVMRVLWEHGALTPPDIQSRFPREIKNPALRSYLTILVEKGHLERRRVGRAYVYAPRTRQESAFRSMYRQLLDTFCRGSHEVLLARLIREEELTEAELKELSKLASEQDGKERGDSHV